jgi:hypothetical protein
MRLRNVLALICSILLVAGSPFSARAEADLLDPPATPKPASCGPQDNPESGLQGRVLASDLANGPIRCNAEIVSRFGAQGYEGGSGGYKVFRYIDPAGHECAFYDSTLLFPVNAVAHDLPGAFVLDMSDPAHPVRTETLVTPAMLSPHESLSFNPARGLLAAGMGNPLTYPGIVDIYDVKADCRHPKLLSSTPLGILGHEGNFAPDGNTLWISDSGNLGGTLTAIDVSDPALPKHLITMRGIAVHGMNISDDGNRLYYADLNTDLSKKGLTILDTSQIQNRTPNPKVPVVANLSWKAVSIPQNAIPVTIGGHPYLVEVDEFSRALTQGTVAPPIGAARIIDIADDAHPAVVSNLRLEVHTAAGYNASKGDPGATNLLQGYTGHYCAVPQREDPGIVACSFILSGLRVFDIRDPLNPKEIAYFNNPVSTLRGTTAYAMSAEAFAPERGEIWYSDGNSGFYNIHIADGVWPFPEPAAQ